MKYYKHTKTGEVYAYETEEERKQFGSSDLKPMTKEEEVHSHLNPIATTEQLAAIGREERDAALLVLDAFVCNPLRYAELTPAQKVEAKKYRQDLLDAPQQKSFPQSHTLPKVPSWL